MGTYENVVLFKSIVVGKVFNLIVDSMHVI